MKRGEPAVGTAALDDGGAMAAQVATLQAELAGFKAGSAVNVAAREGTIDDRRGQRIRLRFTPPLAGPIRLGHSSSFGLGLFRPIEESAEP